MCTLESSRIAICTEKLQKQRILGLAGSQMKGNLDRLGSGQICKLVSLSGLLLFETDFWQKKIQPFSLFWVRYSLGIYSGHGMPDLQTHQLNYPLKVQSIRMHET